MVNLYRGLDPKLSEVLMSALEGYQKMLALPKILETDLKGFRQSPVTADQLRSAINNTLNRYDAYNDVMLIDNYIVVNYPNSKKFLEQRNYFANKKIIQDGEAFKTTFIQFLQYLHNYLCDYIWFFVVDIILGDKDRLSNSVIDRGQRTRAIKRLEVYVKFARCIQTARDAGLKNIPTVNPSEFFKLCVDDAVTTFSSFRPGLLGMGTKGSRDDLIKAIDEVHRSATALIRGRQIDTSTLFSE